VPPVLRPTLSLPKSTIADFGSLNAQTGNTQFARRGRRADFMKKLIPTPQTSPILSSPRHLRERRRGPAARRGRSSVCRALVAGAGGSSVGLSRAERGDLPYGGDAMGGE